MLKLKNGQTTQQHIQVKPKLNILFKRRRHVKKQLYKNNEIFILYAPKKITLEPHQEMELNMQIQIDYPDELIPEFVLIPSLSKREIEADVSQYSKGEFYRLNFLQNMFYDTL